MKSVVAVAVMLLFAFQSNAQCNAFVTVTSTGNPGEYVFNNQSTGGNPNAPTISILTTGDGTTYTLSGFLNSITHQYTTVGGFEYCITVYDSLTPCTDTYCDSVYVNTPGGGTVTCDAYFTSNVQANYNDYYFDISGANGTANVTHFWEFGDGVTSAQASPYHTYFSSGAYEVCHTVTDVNQQCTETYCDSVYVTNGAVNCQAGFTWCPDPNVSQTVTVVNTSTGGPNMTYYWDFGDGSNATGAYPTHTYQNLGSYLVCLTINDPLSGCTSTYCDSIAVYQKASGFTINVVPPTLGMEELSDNDFKVYPNPAKDMITVLFNGEASSILILDINGKEVLNQHFASKINIASLEKGLYLIKIDGVNYARLIKE